MTDQTTSYMTDNMPAPTVDYFYLARRVARIFALPQDPETWSEEQTQEVNDMIQEGLRMFYNPPIVDAFGQHVWSFLNPSCEIQIVADQQWYKLPYDFDHMDPDATFTYSGDNSAYPPIGLTSESRIRKLDYANDYTSYPRLAALRIVRSDGYTPEHYEVGFFPTPDGSYKLAYTYHAVPHAISRAVPYPVGASTHGQLILLAVEAAAEMYEQDGPGHRNARFETQLKADIVKDARRGNKIVGYAGNGIHWPGPGRRSELCYQKSVTYNGNEYFG